MYDGNYSIERTGTSFIKAIDLYYSAIGKQEKEKSNDMNDLIEQLLTMYEMENMKNGITKQSHSEQESPDDGQR